MQTSLTNYYNKNKKQVNIKNKLSDKTIKFNNASNEDIEENLIKFDLDPRYGPCKGITRSKRYELASKLKLNPPQNIKNMISQSNSEQSYYDKFI